MRAVAIVGANVTQEELLSINSIFIKQSESVEFWSMNNLFKRYPEVEFSRWFELHKFERIKNVYTRRGVATYGGEPVYQYLKGIASLDIPVYMQKPLKIIPKAMTYDIKKMKANYGDYYGCSFALMTAMALLEHDDGEKIDILMFIGVGLSLYEYYFQRPSTEYFIGRCQGAGINVVIHNTSNLLKANYTYGFEENIETIRRLHQEPMKSMAERFICSLSSDIDRDN